MRGKKVPLLLASKWMGTRGTPPAVVEMA